MQLVPLVTAASLFYNSALMIFTPKTAGKWVASKNDKIVATGKSLKGLMKKTSKRSDSSSLCYDKVPAASYFAGWCHGI